jgi:general secretion pathway protein I
MGVLAMALSNKRKISGFTLIEVLIALAILSIALTAIIKASSQNIRDTLYLQNKTIAHWVGLEVINKIRAHVLLVTAREKIHEENTVMLNQQWHWQASIEKTPNPHIKEIKVTVAKMNEKNPLAQLTSYLYVPN